ncbi:hypothetical protein [Peribacillus sp. Hz7]|uniref:hypothetical protein n=1 Tax=Peribacillus sp. Hz7 TaxID=3344873 RepID=UPI0035CA717E
MGEGGNSEQAAPANLESVATTTQDDNDGKIAGVTTEMEYRLKGETEFIPVTGTEITGLKSGIYEVRFVAKEGYNASPTVEVVVGDYLLEAPANGDTTMGALGVTAVGAKFIASGLVAEGTNGPQVPSTLAEVATFLKNEYDATLNTDAIVVTDGNIEITNTVLSTEDWNKIKANGDKTIPYRITLVKDSATAPVSTDNKVLKIAIYEDGKAVLETIQ